MRRIVAELTFDPSSSGPQHSKDLAICKFMDSLQDLMNLHRVAEVKARQQEPGEVLPVGSGPKLD